MPFLSPMALAERLAEGDADILHGVVIVDMQVTFADSMSRSISP
jgi:hypothetical protein